MFAFGQRLLRGEGPCPFLIHHHVADDLAIVEEGDRVAGVARTGQGRLVVISDATVADGTGDRALVVHRARQGSVVGSCGIHKHQEAIGFGRMSTILVDNNCSKDVFALPQWLVRGK